MQHDPINTPEAMREAAALIDLIGEFGRAVWSLLDNTEENEAGHVVCPSDFEKVSDLLDRIDALPFHEDGVILGTGAKLQAAIAQTFVIASPAQTDARAMEWLLNEALTKVENDRSMWNAEWLEWCVSVRAALTPAPVTVPDPLAEAARVLTAALDERHRRYITAKGRNPASYVSKFSMAITAISALTAKVPE